MLEYPAVKQSDPEIYAAMQRELERQQTHIELIASENFVSPAVMAGDGFAPDQQVRRGLSRQALLRRLRVRRRGRGHRPRAREASSLAPSMPTCSPIPARRPTLAVYFALLEPGDTVLGMSLSNGGHLTHGSPVNLSGKYFNFVAYGARREDRAHRLRRGAPPRPGSTSPKLIVAGASAYRPRHRLCQRFREIADEVRRAADGGHGPHRRPRGRGRASRTPCPMPTWSPPPPTRRCAAPAAA